MREVLPWEHFFEDQLVGFVLSVLAYKGNEKIFYSHMTAIDKSFQNFGIGTKLKWSQRERALKGRGEVY